MDAEEAARAAADAQILANVHDHNAAMADELKAELAHGAGGDGAIVTMLQSFIDAAVSAKEALEGPAAGPTAAELAEERAKIAAAEAATRAASEQALMDAQAEEDAA